MIPFDPILITYPNTYALQTPKNQAVGYVYLDNRTQYYLKVTFRGTAVSDWIPADSARIFDLTQATGFQSYIDLQPVIVGVTSASINPATQQAICTIYAPGEIPPPLVALTPGVSSLSIANSVQNDGNLLGTSVVEATPVNYGFSFVLLKNDGTFVIQAISNGTPTTLVDIIPGSANTAASATYVGTISNSSKAQQLTDVNGQNLTGLYFSYAAGQITFTWVPSGFSSADVVMGAVNASATVNVLKLGHDGSATMLNGPFNFRLNGSFSGIQTITGSGNGTFSHSLGVSPANVILTVTSGGASVHQEGSFTSTTFTISGLSGSQAWKAFVYV